MLTIENTFREDEEGDSDENDPTESDNEPEEEEPKTPEYVATKQVQKDVLNKLCTLLPHKFIIESNENVHIAQKGLALNNPKPQFKIDPIIDGTWLDPPKEQDSDVGA